MCVPGSTCFSQTLEAVGLTGVGISTLNAVNDNATTVAGTSATINVLGNDVGQAIAISSVSSPANGSAQISANQILYTPNAGFIGSDSFTYIITDDFNQTATATVTVTVNPPGLDAIDDSVTTSAGQAITIPVLANDSGTDLTLTQVGTPARGSVTISGNQVAYTPDVGFSGTDTFTYTIMDHYEQTATATVTVTVNAPGLNAVDDSATTSAGQAVTISVLANDSGTGLTLTQVGAPGRGSATISGNQVAYTPGVGFSGTDTFTYTITDQYQQTATATVTVTVNAPGLNAVDDSATTSARQAVTISVLANDSGTGLTLTQVGTPARGSAQISGNQVVYTPGAGFSGTDTFTYAVTDQYGQTATATVTVTVNAPGLNAINDSATTQAGQAVTINVLTNDTGEGIILSNVNNPAHGSATISGNQVVYTPDSGFASPPNDSFTYTIRDSFGQTDTATVQITVRPPTLSAVNDSTTTPARTAISIPVLANDSGTGLTITQIGNPTHGSAIAGGGGTIAYTPDPNFAATDSFTYTIRDSFGQTDTATVQIRVIAPTIDAVNDSAEGWSKTPVVIPVLANDIGTGLTVTQASTPAHGSALIGADGSITYTSVANFTGNDRFTYTISDGISTDTATVTLKIAINKEEIKKKLEDAALTPNAKKIVPPIVDLCFERRATANFLRDCDPLITNPDDPGISGTLEAITPKSLGNAPETSLRSTATQMLGIRTRMASLRTGIDGIDLDLNIQHGGWTLSDQDVRYLLASLGGGGPSAEVKPKFGPLGIFVSGTFNFGDRDRTENQSGFDFKNHQVTVGADYRFTDQLALGSALSFNSADTDMDNKGGYLDTQSYSLTLYGTYSPSERFYIDGLIGYGWDNYDQQRNIAYRLATAAVDQHFKSDYDGRQFFADLGVGYQFTQGNLVFGPEVRVSYLDTQVDSFKERAGDNGSGSAWAVGLEEQNLESLVTSVGGRAKYLITQPWGTLQPELEFSWLHEFNDESRFIRGYFLEGDLIPENSFELALDQVDTNYFRWGVSLGARFNRGPSALLRYRSLLGYENLESHAISAELRWEF